MRLKLPFFLLCFAISSFAFADVFTVDNGANSPGQYTDLQTAIDASSAGDTIYVKGSATTYGTINLYWNLTIIGEGYDNPNGENSILTALHFKRSNGSISSSNSKVSGFLINSSITFNGDFSGGNATNETLSNIIIERCKIRGAIDFHGYTNCVNDTIRNCYFYGSQSYPSHHLSMVQYAGYHSEVVIHNNLFDNSYFLFSFGNDGDFSDIVIKNNTFINVANASYNVFYGSSNPPASTNNGVVVENNIFRGVYPKGCRNCVFNNNLTYLAPNDTLIYDENPGSVGGGNIIGQDPDFVNYPFTGGWYDFAAHDLHLDAGSPGINAGADGTNIGMYGGVLPFEQLGSNPAIPQMEYVTFPNGSAVGVGGTLDVEFKSYKQD